MLPQPPVSTNPSKSKHNQRQGTAPQQTSKSVQGSSGKNIRQIGYGQLFFPFMIAGNAID
uniref:Uncharacterized protein n=1 Tax=Arundo donax TaxID=35708 RepID=A0A0A9CD56_ARUDO